MGWDMYAVNRNGNWNLSAEQKTRFKNASDLVAAEAGSVDGSLADGGLGLSSCASALEAMTPLSAYSNWGPDDMAEAFKRASLPETFDGEYDKMHHLSAYHFMRVCAELGLGANASY